MNKLSDLKQEKIEKELKQQEKVLSWIRKIEEKTGKTLRKVSDHPEKEIFQLQLVDRFSLEGKDRETAKKDVKSITDRLYTDGENLYIYGKEKHWGKILVVDSEYMIPGSFSLSRIMEQARNRIHK